jgi:DNA/RNA endonuclease G (NUC1)
MRSSSIRALAVCALVSLLAVVVSAAVSITTGAAYVQTFDSIGTAATATLPVDFRVDRTATTSRTPGNFAAAGTATTATGGPNLSTSASNGIYNFGAGTTAPGGSDRAIGFLASGTNTHSGNVYVQLTNTSGGPLAGLHLAYDVEKYRNGLNPNGFRIQMFYSVDGSTWTNAGADFLTSFPADAANTGFSTAPGLTVPVAKTLSATIPSGSDFYLAWNYSVNNGTTVTNAQALAIDNVNITGIPGETTTDAAPSVSSTAPAANAINVPVDSTVAINFSETVNAPAGAFSFVCAGSPHAFTPSTSPAASFTLVPAAPLPYNATCTVTVAAAQVTDVDADDPPDQMASDFAFSFITVEPPPTMSDSVIVISQIYGGGGNSGAAYQNDYVELFNRGTDTVDIGGWSLQYTSAAGDTWEFNTQPLGGTIAPGEYLLVSMASGGDTGAALPQANINGQINMSATAGKIALVNGFDGLVGTCPIGDPHLMDFVGYGSAANCQEGTTKAPAPSNTTALLRRNGGSFDTDRNGSDFVTGAPTPRRTAPIVELGPFIFRTDPRANATTAPRDATIAVTFTEPVGVAGEWFDLSCTTTGRHTDATFAASGQAQYITPNVEFLPGEQCTVTVFKNQVFDLDTDDSGPDTDNLRADHTWTFTVATGTAPPYTADVHLALGNPNGATANPAEPNNYLMEKAEFTLAYNRALGRPNWVSWHLSDEWVGTLTRVDTFRPDPAVPPDWYRVQSFDFAESGFDRGHMVPNADRDKETSIPINQATFLMSNMVAQAPDNNQGPWANMENDLRALLGTSELYIVAGGVGAGGTGSSGFATTLADGHVTVPASTWKVALVLPKSGGDDVARVSCSTRTIAVIMPNTQGIRTTPWQNFIVTVDDVEALTGYDFFSNVPEPYQRCVEAGINGDNPPLVKGEQAIAFAPLANRGYDATPFTVSATGGLSGNPVTFAASGACTATGVNGTTITLVSLGACTITASQAGSPIYDPAPNVTRTFTVVDGIAPVIADITVTPGVLGPPNHKMIDVTVGYTATDFSGEPVCALSVASNEPVNGAGDGNTATDWQVIDAHRVKLRAERAGGGTGRIYTVAIHCTDASGNASTATGTVSVAK